METFTSSNSLFSTKPLGSYRCGGTCTPEGFVGTDPSSRVPCLKCRVYAVVPGKLYEHGDGVLVRARTGEEAIDVYSKEKPGALQISVRLFNHEWDKKTATARYVRDGATSAWTRALSRPDPEQAANLVAYHVLQKAKVAVRDWKLPPATVAASIELALRMFMRENQISKKKA